MKTDELQAKVAGAERALRLVWVIAFGSIVFSMLTVTPLVQRVTPDGWDKTAPLLPLVVDAAVIIVVRMDATISGFNAHGGFWPAALRWMTGLFTLALNIGNSALEGDMVGVGVHSVCPLLLIATSEAIPRYRRTIAAAVTQIRREQAAERERREQQQRAREQQDRERREQAEQRREQAEREAREQSERAAREQREHEARLAREQRDHQALLERQRLEQEATARQAEQDRLARVELARIAAEERREQAEREEKERREKEAEDARKRQEAAAAAVREQRQAARAAQSGPVREQPQQRPEAKPAPVREHRPLHAVNTPRQAPVNTSKEPVVNTDKVSEDEALRMIRDAVNTGSAGVRALARQTGWSPAWVSGQINAAREASGEQAPAAAEDGEPVSA